MEAAEGVTLVDSSDLDFNATVSAVINAVNDQLKAKRAGWYRRNAGEWCIRSREDVEPRSRAGTGLGVGRVEKGMRMAEDAIRDDYEDKYLGGGEDDVIERLAEIDDETADQRAQALLEGLEDYDLDEEDRALLGAWGFDIEEEEEQLADPVVAIVVRPNVGKSTIINRILETP